MLEVRVTRDAAGFYERVAAFLLQREAEHNLILGIVGSLVGVADPQYPDPFLASVERDGEVVGAAMRTPPHNLVLSEGLDEEGVAALVQAARQVYEQMSGVSGPPATARRFAALWHETTGQPFAVAMAQRIYRLSRVQPVAPVCGYLRPGESGDRDVLVRWLRGFHEDVSVDASPIEEAADRLLAHEGRGIFFWDDDGPVSMAGRTGRTPHGVRIGPVYTPPEQRRRGYATACVAALSQKMLDEGCMFCFLYTDLANPTSNHIYQTIGYEPVAEVDMYHFRDVITETPSGGDEDGQKAPEPP